VPTRTSNLLWSSSDQANTSRLMLILITWMCDTTGPLWPNQTKAYNYCFVACDSNTRYLYNRFLFANCKCANNMWMSADAMICVRRESICFTGQRRIPQNRLKHWSPIFITPHQSDGNSTTERMIGKLKGSIHEMAIEKKEFLAKIHSCVSVVLAVNSSCFTWS
jgi:hypothetical protein